MTPPRPTQLTEAEYREHPALNFSKLAAYYNDGIYSPDHALIQFDSKSYFEYGKMFESMLQDATSGSNIFEERFYLSKVTGALPEKLVTWIDDGEDLNSHIKYNKDGVTRNGTCKTLHAFIDEALENQGKIPVPIQYKEMLDRHLENMLKMRYLDASVEDILSKAQWQVPIIFTDYDGVEKKALVDCLVDLGGQFLLIDIKTTAGFKKFGYMLRDHYFIQDLLYTNAVNIEYGDCKEMVFFVASKEAPYLCQPFVVDYGGIDFKSSAIDEFFALCESYKKWVDAGSFPKGWLPLQTVKHYPKQ